MPTNYPGLDPIPNNNIPSDINLDQIVVADVETQLKNFSSQPNCLKANVNDKILKKNYGSKVLDATHFQGIIRVRNSSTMIVSGGDKISRHGCVFVFNIESVFHQRTSNALDFGSNTTFRLQRTPAQDQLMEIVSISEGNFWHVGGISAIGDLMITPIEDAENNVSKIEFYNIQNPTLPIHYKHIGISRDIHFGKIGCAAMCRLPNQFFILAAWRDEGKVGLFDIYFSKSTDLNDGFHQERHEVIQVTFDKLGYNNTSKPQYQSIQFLMQQDGTIFLTGCWGKNNYPVPNNGGNNSIDLYKIILNQIDLTNAPTFKEITVSYLSTKKIANASLYYNFEAAAGFYSINGRLALYSPFYYLRDHSFMFAEFCQDLAKSSAHLYTEAIIELYEDKNLEGRCLRLYGDIDLDDLSNTSVQGFDFTDQISSVAFLLPGDTSLVLTNGDGATLTFHGEEGVVKILPVLGEFDDEVNGVELR